METEEKYCVVTFNTTNYALDFEKKIKSEGIDTKLVPVPRELSSSCGLAARVVCNLKKEVLEICESKNIEIDDFHMLTVKKKKSLLDKLFK